MSVTVMSIQGFAPGPSVQAQPMTTARKEAERYGDLWRTVPTYGDHSPGLEHLDRLCDMAQMPLGSTVLDAGCGSGKTSVALANRGFAVTMLDLTDAGLVSDAVSLPFEHGCIWAELPARDYVWCCDVMEHIPTEYVMLSLAHLIRASKTACVLSISTVPDAFGVWVGEPLHQTVRPFVWWKDRLSDVGTVVEARDVMNAGLYVVTP